MSIFIENKYTKWYYNIISNARLQHRIKLKPSDSDYVYYERHHIIPDCFYKSNRSKGKRIGWLDGNSDSSDNLILLTAKEHFICHLLLTKMIKNGSNLYKMFTELQLMCGSGRYHTHELNSKWYQTIRENLAKLATDNSKIYVFNEFCGKKKIRKYELSDYLNRGWSLDRTVIPKINYYYDAKSKRTVF